MTPDEVQVPIVVQVPLKTFVRMDDRLKWLVWLMAGNLTLSGLQVAPEAAAFGVAFLAVAYHAF